MVNIYTGQLVKVLWNGVYSQNFPVINGAKQGGILSPVLFVSILMNCCLLYDRQMLDVLWAVGSWVPTIYRRYRVNGAYCHCSGSNAGRV